MALRQRLDTKSVHGAVAQRLKRRATIIHKLGRHPNIQLTTMQDVGGCRAVLPDRESVRRYLKGWGVRHRLVEEYNYVADPALSGYRAVHWVVKYPVRGHNSLIEMQIRTELQHEWDLTVERLGSRLRRDLKSGEGPIEILDWLRAVADAFAYIEQGDAVPPSLDERIEDLGRHARSHLLRKGAGG